MLTRSPRHVRGFTLVELMVTLALMALLMFAVMPDVGAWMRGMQIRSQAESIQSGLQRARNEAVRRNKPVQFSLVSLDDPSVMDKSCTPSTTAASWVISLEKPDGKCETPPSETTAPRIIATNPAGAGAAKVKITATGAVKTKAHTVTFDNYGRLKDNIATITAIDVESSNASDDEARPLRIVVTVGGLTRMCDPKVTIAGDPRKCP